MNVVNSLSGELVREDAYRYPPILPYTSGTLSLDPIHTLYYEESGNPSGQPLLLVHGGPGGGINPAHRELADPEHYRIIHFDQRGCGNSTPFGELRENTTWHLVSDMERLRDHLGIERWAVLGGSWGSSLTLAYAETHPRRCAGIIVTGIFLCRQIDYAWWWRGIGQYFPEAWDKMVAFLPKTERESFVQAYHQRCTSDDPEVYMPATLALTIYETLCLNYEPNQMQMSELLEGERYSAMGRLLMHYDKHQHFMEPNQLLNNIERIRSVPGIVINGRFDTCTVAKGAWDLCKAWPEAELVIPPACGHVWSDLEMGRAVIEATDKFKHLDYCA